MQGKIHLYDTQRIWVPNDTIVDGELDSSLVERFWFLGMWGRKLGRVGEEVDKIKECLRILQGNCFSGTYSTYEK